MAIFHREAVSVTVTPLGTPSDGLECELKICGTALGVSTPNRSFYVGFERPGACGLARSTDHCSNTPMLDLPPDCPSYYDPAAAAGYNGWELDEGGDPELLVVCRVFFLSDILASPCPGAAVVDGGSTITFTVYAETRSPVPECPQAEGCDDPSSSCCDVVTHFASQVVNVTISGGVAALDILPVSSLNLDAVLLPPTFTTHDGRVCSYVGTAVDAPATLGEPSLEWLSPQTGHTIQPVGYVSPCPAGRTCQKWRVCTKTPVVYPGAPAFYDNVTATFCVFAGGVAQSVTAVVDIELCITFEDGGEQEVVVVDKTPTVFLRAYYGKDCYQEYAAGAPVIDGSCLCVEAYVEGCDSLGAANPLLLDYSYVLVTPLGGGGGAEDPLLVYDPYEEAPQALLPGADRGVVDASVLPGPGGSCSLRWTQTVDVSDGPEFSIVLHYSVSLGDGEEGGQARRLLAGPAGAASVAAARQLVGCTWGLPGCSTTSGHAHLWVSSTCDHGYSHEWDKCDDDDRYGHWRNADGSDDSYCHGGSRRPSHCAHSHRWTLNWRSAAGYCVAALLVLALCCVCVLGANHTVVDKRHPRRCGYHHTHHCHCQSMYYYCDKPPALHAGEAGYARLPDDSGGYGKKTDGRPHGHQMTETCEGSDSF